MQYFDIITRPISRKNRLLAKSQRFIVLWKRNLERRSRIALRQVIWPKYQISKNQDGRRPPFEDGFIAMYQPQVIRYWWYVVRWCKFWFQSIKSYLFANQTSCTAFSRGISFITIASFDLEWRNSTG